MPSFLVMYSNDPPTMEHLARLAGLAPGVEVSVASGEDEAVEMAPSADAILGHRYLRQALPRAEQLRWVQSTAAGVAHLPTLELAARRVVLTRCPIFAETVATHAVALALSILRALPDAMRAQEAGQWGPRPVLLPWPETAMVVGLGRVGQAVAARLRPMVTRIIGVSRHPVPADGSCDEILTPVNWRDALGRVDLCVLAVSDGPENRHLVDEAVMRALPAHAVVVNVSRGATIDQEALERTLRAGHLGGAGLDVLDPVPETPGASLWSVPRLVVTPKIGVFSGDRQARLERFVEGQAARFLRGELLEHVVTNRAAEAGAGQAGHA